MDLWGMSVRKERAQTKVTVLRRPNGSWQNREVNHIVNGLMTSASQHPKYPVYLLIAGEYTKQQVLGIIGAGQDFSLTVITGLDNPELPFRPQFI
jgi:hypothetical protein